MTCSKKSYRPGLFPICPWRWNFRERDKILEWSSRVLETWEAEAFKQGGKAGTCMGTKVACGTREGEGALPGIRGTRSSEWLQVLLLFLARGQPLQESKENVAWESELRSNCWGPFAPGGYVSTPAPCPPGLFIQLEGPGVLFLSGQTIFD